VCPKVIPARYFSSLILVGALCCILVRPWLQASELLSDGSPSNSVDVSVRFILPDQPNPLGKRLTYSLVISNAGPVSATGVRLTNQIPAQLIEPLATTSQGTFSIIQKSIIWEAGTLVKGGTATISVEVMPVAVGTVAINAAVRPLEFDPNYFQNNVGSVFVPLGVADLAVSIQPPGSPIQAGVPFSLTITVTNHGPDPSEATLFADGGHQFVGQDFVLSQGNVIELRDGAIPWQVEFGIIPPLSTATLALTLVPKTADILTFSGHITGSVTDDNDENNLSAASLNVGSGYGIIEFDSPATKVSETSAEISVNVLRHDGTLGTVQADVLFQNGDAVAGVDFLPATNKLTFGPGESSTKVVIRIPDNLKTDCNRAFAMTLANPSGGAFLFGITNASVFIVDNEIEPSGAVQPISLSTNLIEMGNGDSAFSSLSADGEVVAFTSLADNLLQDDTNGYADVFLKGFRTGETRLISKSRFGTGSANGASIAPQITPDGRHVAFLSFASDLVTNEVSGTDPQIYIQDIETGVTKLVTINSTGTGVDVRSQFVSEEQVILGMSTNGQTIAFWNDGFQLGNGEQQLFVRDMETGKTSLITSKAKGGFAVNGYRLQAYLSDNGQFIAFISGDSEIVSGLQNIHGNSQIYLRDLVTDKTIPISLNYDSTALANDSSFDPHITPDGRFVLFQSLANDLVPDDDNPFSDIFVRDLLNNTTRRLSEGILGPCETLSVTADGRYVAFRGGFRPGQPGPAPSVNSSQIYLTDCRSNITTLLTLNCRGGRAGNGHSFNPFITRNGRYVFFHSYASDLTSGEFTEGVPYLFRRDLVTGKTLLVTQNRDLTGACRDSSFLPGFEQGDNVSWDGTTAVFVTGSEDVLYEDHNRFLDLFRWQANAQRERNPHLYISYEDSQCVLRWPSGARGFVLQVAPDLLSNDWETLQTTNTIFRLNSSNQAFFRLKK
jgi:uncharacterized repeat protein (TIGR01451 family)